MEKGVYHDVVAHDIVKYGLIPELVGRLPVIVSLTELDNVAVMNPLHTVVLVLICIATSVIGGLIPAIMASMKDPVTALRTD